MPVTEGRKTSPSNGRAIALGFVVYNAEPVLLQRLQLALDAGFEVYLFDNSPLNDLVRTFCDSSEKSHYITCGKNLGLGLGVSAVCAQAFYSGHKALLFFDQDSVFDQTTLFFIENFYTNRPQLASTHSAVVFRGEHAKGAQAQSSFSDVLLAINSGSLFYLENLKQINWHNEKYFVDCVDYEFCLRSKVAGFQIGQYSYAPGFDHVVEQPDEAYRFFGKKYGMRAYSLKRICDQSKGSVRLMISAVLCAEFKFSLVIFRLYAIYMATQLIVRVLGVVGRKGQGHH